jgi:hypothetical protein
MQLRYVLGEPMHANLGRLHPVFVYLLPAPAKTHEIPRRESSERRRIRDHNSRRPDSADTAAIAPAVQAVAGVTDPGYLLQRFSASTLQRLLEEHRLIFLV